MGTFGLVLSGIQAALAASPAVANLVIQAKDWITALFSAGVITRAQQDALHGVCDAHQAAVLAGQRPDALVVDPDPA